ncbi:MAG: low molecular weight phosphatase family protein, partial [Candidatus Methylacidiphilaceae bacterium]
MRSNLLFICTGNYYRSRFAEAVFNFYASVRELPWRASSRGLAVGPTPFPISPFACARLQELGIALSHTSPSPTGLTETDLARSDRAIALEEREHRPMIVRLFPQWIERIRFWDVADVDRLPPAIALAKIENHAHLLLEELAGGPPAAMPPKKPLGSSG